MGNLSKGTRVKLNITIDCGLKEVLVELAAGEGRDVSWIVGRAIRDFLKNRGRGVPANCSAHASPP